jgi:uncharacterized membrane protein YbaN (DUF454 family)
MIAVAGAILPGNPMLPFLLLTTHHAARSSPLLDRFLRRRPRCAAILSQAESSGTLLGLNRTFFLKMLTIGAVAVVIVLVVYPPLPVVIGLELGLMAVLCVRQFGRTDGHEVAPGIPDSLTV